jgi:hypothetical protein
MWNPLAEFVATVRTRVSAVRVVIPAVKVAPAFVAAAVTAMSMAGDERSAI